MTEFSQKDPLWASKKLGTCSVTIGGYGCFITCLAMMCDKRPDEVNQLLKDNGGYVEGCMVDSETSADILNLNYSGKTTEWQNSLCIAETNDYAPNYPQHFVLWLGDGHIVDPLIGYVTANNYNISNFRFFKPKGETMSEPVFIDKPMATAIATNFINYMYSKQDFALIKNAPTKANAVEWLVNNNMDFVAFLKEKVNITPNCGKLADDYIEDVKKYEKDIEDLEAEQIKIMKEQEDAIKLIHDECTKKCNLLVDELKICEEKECICPDDFREKYSQEIMKNTELQRELDKCKTKECPPAYEPCEPCPDLDILTSWDLVKLVINKWLRVK